MRSKWRCFGLVLASIAGNLRVIEPAHASLYAFTSHTFTNCTTSGSTGPSQLDCRNSYSTTWDDNDSYFTVTGGIQSWVVPFTGTYEITAAGAVGGATPSAIGGKGRVITSQISLTQGETIKIIVGQTGGRLQFTTGYSGGGGGGSFVVRSSGNAALLIAGGGGGAAQGNATYVSTQNGVDAALYNATAGTAGTAGPFSSATAGSGGTNGGGGAAGGVGGGPGGGSGGGGFTGNGTKGTWGGNAGFSFSNGGNGGSNIMGYGTSTLNIFGGFGGGAGAGAHTNYEADSGGGGGYSGGGGGSYRVGAGGGGGNFVTGTYVSNSLNSGVGYVTIVALAAPDTTAPTFTSSLTFSAAENIATSATAATIRVSESATVTISSGADAARFNITRSETNTAIIKFNVSPDFEAPVDVGGNNIYDLTMTATDTAGNTNTQSITITVTDVVDTSSFNSLALVGSATTATYRTAVVITANVSVPSKVTFRVNGKVLPGCKNKLATGSGSSYSVTCNWRPSNRGQVSLTAAATPTGAGISSTTSNPVNVMVANRVGTR
jgi:hypothetical protein